MSQVETDLCLDIVKEQFGPIVSQLAHDLLLHGRQTLQQLCYKKSKKDSTQIRKSLAILLHHRLATYSEWSERGRGTNYYQFDVGNCFLRLRFAYYVQLTKQSLSMDAAKIVQALLCHGKLIPSQILINSGLSESEFFEAFKILIQSKYVIITDESDLQTKKDIYMKMEDSERSNAGMPLTTSESKKLKLRMAAEEDRVNSMGPASKHNITDYTNHTDLLKVCWI